MMKIGVRVRLGDSCRLSVKDDLFEVGTDQAQGIEIINAAARRLARRHRHVEYLDCNEPFTNSTGGIIVDLMPDKLHPNAAGAAIGCTDRVPEV